MRSLGRLVAYYNEVHGCGLPAPCFSCIPGWLAVGRLLLQCPSPSRAWLLYSHPTKHWFPNLPRGCDHPAFIQGGNHVLLPLNPLCWGIQENNEHPGTVRDTNLYNYMKQFSQSALWKVSHCHPWAPQNQSLSQTAMLPLLTAPGDLLTSWCLEAQCSEAYSWQSPSVSCAGIWLPACMTLIFCEVNFVFPKSTLTFPFRAGFLN